MPPNRTLKDICAALGVEPTISPGLDDVQATLTSSGDPRYDLAEELGRGAQGRVMHGVDQNLRRSVAIKVMDPEMAESPERVQAFIEEAIITGGLEHPNIVPAYDVGYTEKLGFYYTMKRLQGRSLSEVLEDVADNRGDARARFSQFKLLLHFVEICRGVAYAHARGVVHSDIKPANVLIGDFGEVAVVDWGLAQVQGPTGARQARANTFAGTPAFMPPEQLAQGVPLPPDRQGDVWALGVVLYSILTHCLPFSKPSAVETMQLIMTAPVPPPRQRAAHLAISPEIEAICMKALQKEPEHRYGSVSELLVAVDAYLEGTRVRWMRYERARAALEEGRLLLEGVAPMEQALDAAGPDRDEALVQMLFARYKNAATVLLGGLDPDHRDAGLEDAIGDVYWRIFLRVYPSRFVAPRGLAREGSDLLTSLSRRCLSAVIRVGRTFISEAHEPTSAPLSREGDDWLATVLGFCRAQSGPSSEQATAMGTLGDHINGLRRVSLFEKMSSFDLLPLAEACSEVRRSRGETFFKRGEAGDALYIVLSGEVAVIREGAVLSVCRRGEVFGEVGVLGSVRTADVVASADTVCLALPSEEFQSIVSNDGEIGWGIMQVLADRLGWATRREASLRQANAKIESE